MFTELFLIRHGATDYSREGKYCGSTDIPLNREGILQIAALKGKEDIPSSGIIYSSLYKRAYQSARLLFPEGKIEPASALSELDFGLWEGLTSEQISAQYGKLYLDWLENPYSGSPPEGEKLPALEERVVNFLTEILTLHQNKKIVCLSHAGPIRVLAGRLLNIKAQDLWKITIGLAGLSYFKLLDQNVVRHYLNKK